MCVQDLQEGLEVVPLTLDAVFDLVDIIYGVVVEERGTKRWVSALRHRLVHCFCLCCKTEKGPTLTSASSASDSETCLGLYMYIRYIIVHGNIAMFRLVYMLLEVTGAHMNLASGGYSGYFS